MIAGMNIRPWEWRPRAWRGSGHRFLQIGFIRLWVFWPYDGQRQFRKILHRIFGHGFDPGIRGDGDHFFCKKCGGQVFL